MEKDKLLIIEDDEDLRMQMKWGLSKDFEVLSAENRPSGLEVFIKEKPPIVTLDLGLPPKPMGVEEGFLALSDMLKHDPFSKVTVITGRDEKENALAAIDRGAYDFLTKPIELDGLRVILRRAAHLARLERENHELQYRLSEVSFDEMLGASPQILKVFTAIRKVATTDAPVLIMGESGTGKELAARAIHRRSRRRDGGFVAINCGAIPENLLESELFGHEKGAFTGAHIQRKGRIELAKDGTLFLDEIGELPSHLQVKLLRFLQEQSIERVGGREEIRVDARVIAAANTDLTKAARDGKFREDLYYRLGVVIISLPPLRERQGDALMLAKVFLHRYAVLNGRKITGFSPQALQAIEKHDWQGNVRELENRIQRAVIMSENARVSPADLQLSSLSVKNRCKNLKEAREALEKDLVKNALTRNDGNISRAAQELGVSRPTLYELLDKLGIER